MNPIKTAVLPPEVMLKRIITVAEAAELRGVHPATFKREHPHLVLKLSKRRVGVRLADVLALDNAAE